MVTSLLLHVNMNQWIYIYVCMYSLDYMVRSGHVCYHDRQQHLRRDDHRPQNTAGIEGIAQNGHQGGGQRQAVQGIVI